MKTLWQTTAGLAAALVLLAGCSGMRTVDTDVTAFPQWKTAPPGPNTTYRFERLPSQQVPQEQQDAVELIARTALGKVGLVFNPTAPRYTVQIASSTQATDGGYGGYGGPGGFGGYGGGSGVFLGGGSGGGGGGVGVGLSFPLGRGATSAVRHELAIVMREVSTQQVVYETRASHGASSGDKLAVLPAMMDAALRGFPEPPLGTRRINVDVPR